MATSKAWRATLPSSLRPEQLQHIDTWAQNHCGCHAMLKDERGRSVLMALHSNRRTAPSYARTLRTAFKRMAIDNSSLLGHWLRLVTVREVLLAVCDAIGSNSAAPPGTSAQEEDAKTGDDDDDTRLVRLY